MIRCILVVITGMVSIQAYSQTDACLRNPDYLTFQTGLVVDRYNSIGIRTFFEYQKDFKGNWQYGIFYEHTSHFGSAITDQPNQLSTNLSLLSLNGYYKLTLVKDRIFWTAGLGLGGVHANWEEKNKIGATVNVSLTLNIRLSKKVYIESSPLLVLLPSNRAYFSTMNAEKYTNFFAVTLFPVGVKVKL